MVSSRSVRFVLVLLCVAVIASCSGNSDGDGPLIFAAASLSDVLTESAEVYEQETGKRIVFSFGGSLTLANQIAGLGAPADGAFVVGQEAIERIADAELVGSNGYSSMLFNQLAVIGRPDSQAISQLSDLKDHDGRIAIGNPDLAPVGEFARQALESAGVWDDISGRLVMTSDVRSAMAAVTTGNSEYAVVYASDVASADEDSFKLLMVVEDGYDSIDYFFVPIKGATNADTVGEFFTFLAGSQRTKEIFNDAGFRWNVHLGPPSVPGNPADVN